MSGDHSSSNGVERAVALVGDAPNTRNLGVNPLFRSIVYVLGPTLEVVALDTLLGTGMGQVRSPSGPMHYRRWADADPVVATVGSRHGQLTAGMCYTRYPDVAQKRRTLAPLDVSGADGFSDMCHRHGFETTVSPKISSSRLRSSPAPPSADLRPSREPPAQVSVRRSCDGPTLWCEDRTNTASPSRLSSNSSGLADDGAGTLACRIQAALRRQAARSRPQEPKQPLQIRGGM